MCRSQPISRRGFLKRGGALAAAPYVLASGALGGGWRKPPSERITLGIIGVKKMGRGHVHNFLRNGGRADPGDLRRGQRRAR